MRNENFELFYPVLINSDKADALCKKLSDKTVIIYGAGIYGWAFHNNFRGIGKDILCYSDNDKLKQTLTYFGKKVIAPEAVPEIVDENTAIVITLRPELSAASETVRKNLLAAGVSADKIYMLPFEKSSVCAPVPIDPNCADISGFELPLLPENCYKPCAISEEDKIGVYLPFYRESPAYMIRTIQSIREQSYKNLKILIFANGCGEEQLSVMQNFAKLDDRIELLIRKENLINSKNRKSYAEHFTYIFNAFFPSCKYVCKLDGDDYFTPDYVEKTVAAARLGNSDVVLCGSYFYNEKPPRELFPLPPAFSAKTFSGKDEIGRFLSEYGVFYTSDWGKLFSEKAFKKYTEMICGVQFDYDSGILITLDDIPLTLNVFTESENVTVLPGISHFFTQRAASMTGHSAPAEHYFFRIIELGKTVSEILKNKGFDEKYAHAVNDFRRMHMALMNDLNVLEKRAVIFPEKTRAALLKIKLYITENFEDTDPSKAASLRRIDDIILKTEV